MRVDLLLTFFISLTLIIMTRLPGLDEERMASGRTETLVYFAFISYWCGRECIQSDLNNS